MAPVRVVYSDQIGEAQRACCALLGSLDIPDALKSALHQRYGQEIYLSPPQVSAVEKGVLRDHSDFLICAPTNSGKTLIAIFRMFAGALETGGRSVYVVPLKALAEEKILEFRDIAAAIVDHGGRNIKVSITTGDYQLTDDFLGSPPPEDGEIVVCTPERLEIMLRNPENFQWARAVSTYVIDEFHLLGEGHRGGTVESLLTRLFVTCQWSSILGLSASVGETERIKKWFTNNGRRLIEVESEYRFPQLQRHIALPENRDEAVLNIAREVLLDENRSLLVFVYRRTDAANLANLLKKELNKPDLVSHFHSGLSSESRKSLVQSYLSRDIKFLITTTSLKMGVNFPVTDVIVRDTYFHGSGRLLIRDILQMIGRAGRGNLPGRAWVLCDRPDGAAYYEEGFISGKIEGLEPQLIPEQKYRQRSSKVDETKVDPVRSVILSEVAAHKEASPIEVNNFIARTYSASCHSLGRNGFEEHFAFLEEKKLIYRVTENAGRYGITKLGQTTSYSGAAAETGAVLGAFLRALIQLEKRKVESGEDHVKFLSRLTDLDFLFLACAGFEMRDAWLGVPSKKALDQLHEYIEILPPDEKPLVNLWRSEDSKDYPTRRILSTLGILKTEMSKKNPEIIFHQMMRTAILLHRHSRGTTLGKLAEEYRVDEGTLENNLKFSAIWILNLLAQICDSRKCYKLDPMRIKVLGLIENLRFGATLGKLLLLEGVGKRTIEKLIEAGYIEIETLVYARKDELKSLGLNDLQVGRIKRFVKRR